MSPGTPSPETLIRANDDLADLARRIEKCRGCQLYRDATQAVFGAGPRRARIMLVGEQPGNEEDNQGSPFVGPAGRFLDTLLDQIGLDRSKIYVTNLVKHFKFERRGKWRIHKSPGSVEISACLPWTEAEIERVRPERIVCLGAVASRALIGPRVRVTRDRGRVFATPFGDWVMPTLHPSAVIRMRDDPTRHEAARALAEDLRRAASF